MSCETSIILGFSAHLSEGMPDSFYTKLYLSRLKPFIQTINLFPKLPFVLHLSGSLLHKIERNHPEFFMLVRDMIKRKQVEIIGGGFYEPMMPLLMHQDKVGQIEMLTTYIRQLLGKRVQGSYIPDIAWEQSVTSALNSVGMTYTFLDEKNFINAGLTKEQYSLPCINEDKGKLITIFPVFSSIKKNLETQNCLDVFNNLLKTKEKSVFTIFPNFFSNKDEGLSEKYLYKFFEDVSSLESAFDWTLPSTFLKNPVSMQKVYFKDGSNKKYLIDCNEAGLVYSKMVWTKSLIDQLKGDKERKHSAQEELWKAQGYTLFCYDEEYENYFYSGEDSVRFPGINNVELRQAAFSAMLVAEKTTREKWDWKASLMLYDFDLDGKNEYLFQSEVVNCYIKTLGASLFEFDFLPKTWNYLNTIKVGAAPSPAFFDIIALPDPENPENFENSRLCGNECFKCIEADRVQQTSSFTLSKNPAAPGNLGSIEINKNFKLNNNIFSVQYEFLNSGSTILDFKFITLINLSFKSHCETSMHIFAYDSYTSFSNNGEKISVSNEKTNVTAVEAIDFQDLYNELIINISGSSSFDAGIEPIYEKYKSPVGEVLEQYQFTQIKVQKPFSLQAGASVCFTLKLGIFH